MLVRSTGEEATALEAGDIMADTAVTEGGVRCLRISQIGYMRPVLYYQALDRESTININVTK